MNDGILYALFVLLGALLVLVIIVVSWVYHLAYALNGLEAQMRAGKLSQPGCRACQCDYCRVQRAQ